ncbi:MAG TPA: Gfo/Idh/MocA family oxidoreductase [Bacteroides sp.]|nr:Gfo/Idh/MocA family oxidoreductase [Bacteroides sp.]
MEKDKDPLIGSMDRRNMLKGLAGIPFLGAFAIGWWRKRRKDHYLKNVFLQELDIDSSAPEIPASPPKDRVIRLGIIGAGGRGSHLLRGAGFADPELIQRWKEASALDRGDKRYEDYLAQEDLNVELNGVCDIYDVRAEKALWASGNIKREGTDADFLPKAKRYHTYQELLAADDIDAVIIGTPDHWHAQMTIDAAKAGKHVYVEKGMTRLLDETYDMVAAVKESGICFQLGHQGRQTESYIKAKEAIDKGLLGKINLIEVCTNRNTPNGAWQYKIDEEAGPHNIDWEQFQGPYSDHPFSLERFFRWRCWWDYGTGLSGDLFTHEYDAINQIMGLGIPNSVASSGGIYFFKDGREVPDVWQVACEYPDRDLTLLYSASLASSRDRGKVIMGHDGHMELGNSLTVWPDRDSTRFKKMISQGIIDPQRPLYSYVPGKKNVDAVTSATEAYFAGRGLLYTYRGGRRVDTTHLHVKEWFDAIRTGTQPSCNIDQGFEEAITAQMALIGYRQNRVVFWDAEKQKIV